MRRRALPLLSLCAGMLSISAVRADAQRVHLGDLRRPNSDAFAQVFENSIEVKFPLPYEHVRSPNPPVVGHYAWRITMETDSAFSIVLTADTALRSNRIRDVLHASSLRVCPANVKSLLDCTESVQGTVRDTTDAIIVEVTDAKVVGRIRNQRTATYVRHVFEPGGRYRVDRIEFIYRDGADK